MAVKIRVRDFQSLGDVSLEIDGLTVVTGTNNTGKSALMRAIRAAFQNAKGTNFIRHGEAKSSVEITFADGHTLSWEKGRGKADKPKYVVDGGKSIHPGQGVPDEVRELGVRPIMAGGREIWPQIARQFDGQVFLLDQPGSVMAEAVADVERVSQLNEALRLAASDQRTTATELNTRRTDLLLAEQALKRFDGLDAVGQEITELEQKAELVQRVSTVIQALVVLQSRHHAAAQLVQTFAGVDEILVPEDQSETIREQERTLEMLKGLRERFRSANGKVKFYHGIGDVGVPEPLSDIEGMIRERDELQALSRRHTRARAQVSRLETAGPYDQIDVGAVERFQGAHKIAVGLRDHLTQARSRVEEAERELASEETELARVKEELAAVLGDVAQCPVCGSPIQHEGAHA